MFVIGAIILFREARTADDDEPAQEDEYAAKSDSAAHGLKVVVTSFLVLFAAEWGDLSQLLTISLTVSTTTRCRCSSAPGARCSRSPASRSSSDDCCSSGSGSRSCTRGCDRVRVDGSVDRVGDDALSDPRAAAVHDRFVTVNGDHPMTDEDDADVREHFVEATPAAMALMLADRLPLPSYVLSDGTSMVPEAHGGWPRRRWDRPPARLVRGLLGGRAGHRRAGVGGATCRGSTSASRRSPRCGSGRRPSASPRPLGGDRHPAPTTRTTRSGAG